MDWITQNWTWIVFAIAVFLLVFIWIAFAIGVFLSMRRSSKEHRMGHAHGTRTIQQQEDDASHIDLDMRPKDPISGEITNPETALNSMYQGRMYYFGSRENRDTFEASPAQYASRAGERLEHRHHRHGC